MHSCCCCGWWNVAKNYLPHFWDIFLCYNSCFSSHIVLLLFGMWHVSFFDVRTYAWRMWSGEATGWGGEGDREGTGRRSDNRGGRDGIRMRRGIGDRDGNINWMRGDNKGDGDRGGTEKRKYIDGDGNRIQSKCIEKRVCACVSWSHVFCLLFFLHWITQSSCPLFNFLFPFSVSSGIGFCSSWFVLVVGGCWSLLLSWGFSLLKLFIDLWQTWGHCWEIWRIKRPGY